MKNYIYILMSFLLVNSINAQIELDNSTKTSNNNNNNTESTSETNFTTEEEFRLIFWIHGLGGNIDSWSSAAQWTDLNYKARSIRPYYAPNDILGASAELSTKLISEGVPVMNAMNLTDRNRNYIIAHSMGTAVSRGIDMQYVQNNVNENEKMFGGMVFFDGFYQGAQIADSAKDGLFYMWAEEGCNDLGDGPLLENIEAQWLIGMFIDAGFVSDFVDNACDAIANSFLPYIAIGFNNSLTYDATTNSTTIAALNNYTSTTEKVGFYSVEDDPVLWRTLSYLATDPNSKAAFQANEDSDIVEDAENLRLMYQAKYDYWDAEINSFNNYFGTIGNYCWGWCSDNIYAGHEYTNRFKCKRGCKNLMKNRYTLRDAYYRGKRWMEKANDKFKTLTGALTYIPTDGTCSCLNKFTMEEFDIDCSNINMQPQGTICFQESVLTPNYEDSDGIVVESTQKNFPGGDTEGNLLAHTSHFQVRNNSALKFALETIYGGSKYPFFKTFER